ncbi:hypothetical protein LOK49_LG07G03384 [Camellia lanceoleosa]|uniref:Uncharacterized protein n=1 Tax=Camellia lanceoleosa TaxID=1840588 RepID=A0ACC0H720_9ERIC|nr:hypothetical protein LOK49_LG07G03384 [Camellia lanceoleosa]
MEGRYGFYSGWTSMRNEEFQEEDVWDVVVKKRTGFTNSKVGSSFESSSSAIAPKLLPSAAKMIQTANNNNNYNTNQEPKIVHQSAPLNIPDWSKLHGNNKISKKASKNVSAWLDDDDDDDDDDGGGVGGDSDDDDDGEMMPPHEWIARQMARTEISSFSVCEGAGRTLKGRDLSRMRNAVLTRTGFLE